MNRPRLRDVLDWLRPRDLDLRLRRLRKRSDSAAKKKKMNSDLLKSRRN